MADQRTPIAIPVSDGRKKKEDKDDASKKEKDDKPKFGVKKPKKKTDLMELDVKRKKEEADFGPLVEKSIPEQVALAKTGKVAEAIENLYGLEKQCRNGGDAISTAKVVTCILDLLWQANDFKGLISNLQLLTKKRGQLKQAVTAMVQKAVVFVDQLSTEKDLDRKLELIDALRAITEGKIYVENERARLTMTLAHIRESQGKIKEAAEILQEVQVETYGSMEKKEKTEFILEQTRLCLDNNDFVRGQIIARKINPRVLTDPDFESLKQRYYTLSIRIATHQTALLEIARAYQHIFDTPTIKADASAWKQALGLMVIFGVLAPHDNDQSDFAARVQTEKLLDELPQHRTLLRLFCTRELMHWPSVETLHKNLIEKVEWKGTTPLWQTFHKRVVEHNIRVVAGYYTRITLPRLAQLLFLSPDDTEQRVSELVVSKSIFAKIDRPRGQIDFVRRKEPTELLDEWSRNVGDLLDLLEKTCHLIQREEMVHNVQ